MQSVGAFCWCVLLFVCCHSSAFEQAVELVEFHFVGANRVSSDVVAGSLCGGSVRGRGGRANLGSIDTVV